MDPTAHSAISDFQVAIRAFIASPAAAMLVFAFGAIWGSFYNVCIARIPLGKSVVTPRSHCFSCKTPIAGWNNIPILSYFLLRGRCRSCGVGFSPRYLMVELLTAVLGLLLFWVVVRGSDAEVQVAAARFGVFFAFFGVLVVLAFIDLDTKRLPDIITLPSVPIFFLAGFGAHTAPWVDRAIGAVAGYVAVRLISDGYYYLRGREGLGLGDGKLLAVMGALLGWQALAPIVFTASFLGVLVAVPALLLARRREEVAPVAAAAATIPAQVPEGSVDGSPEGSVEESSSSTDADESDEASEIRFTQIPFGPFLALSAIAYVLAADRVWPWFFDFLQG